MNKKEYLEKLRMALNGLSADEIQDIIYDYEEHFSVGLSKGKTHEEISIELGEPDEVAKNYIQAQDSTSSNIHSNDNDYIKNTDSNYSAHSPKRKSYTKLVIAFILFICVYGVLNLSSNFIRIQDGNDIISIGLTGIKVSSGNEKVSIGLNGIKVQSADDQVTVGFNGIKVNGKEIKYSTSNDSNNILSDTVGTTTEMPINNISNVIINSSFADLKIIPEERDTIQVRYYGTISANAIPWLDVSEKNDKLEIKLELPKKIGLSINSSDIILEVLVPNTFITNYDIKSSSGNITSDIINAKTFNASTSSGNLIINNMSSDKINLSSSSGDISIKNHKGDLNLSSSSGDMQLNLDGTPGNINISTSSGDITAAISNNSNYSIKGSSSSGRFRTSMDMNIKENKKRSFIASIGDGSGSMNISTSSGDVTFTKK